MCVCVCVGAAAVEVGGRLGLGLGRGEGKVRENVVDGDKGFYWFCEYMDFARHRS